MVQKDNQNSRIEALTDAFLASEQMDGDAAYLSRGRRFGHATIEDLTSCWVNGFRSLLNEPTDTLRQAFADLGAEFRLRGVVTPDDLVRPEYEVLRAKIEEEGRSPEWLLKKVAAFRRSRENPNG